LFYCIALLDNNVDQLCGELIDSFTHSFQPFHAHFEVFKPDGRIIDFCQHRDFDGNCVNGRQRMFRQVAIATLRLVGAKLRYKI